MKTIKRTLLGTVMLLTAAISVVFILPGSCKKDAMVTRVPRIRTLQLTSLTETSATCGGEITFDGGAPITARGVCWSTDGTPTTASSLTSDGDGTGIFTSNISGLSPSTFYHLRAYAANMTGTSYGELLSFRTWSGTYVKDIDSNAYHTVTIGTREWMAENLKTTKLNDGTAILNLATYNWPASTYPAFNCPSQDPPYKDIYGALYNGYAVLSGKLCPKGWHVPSDAEWQSLIVFLGDSLVAGGKLKESGTAHWDTPNASGTNESGFTGLPGGALRDSQGCKEIGIGGIGYMTVWWSDTRLNDTLLFCRSLQGDTSRIYHGYGFKTDGYSVRCIRD